MSILIQLPIKNDFTLPLAKKIYRKFLKVKERIMNKESSEIPIYLDGISKELEMLLKSIPDFNLLK